MTIAATLASITFAITASPSLADADRDSVKVFIDAVKQGGDLAAAYPTAVSASEAASLQRVSKCNATNLMKQKNGDYTVVWSCRDGSLGMRVAVQNGNVATVSTFKVEKRPNVQGSATKFKPQSNSKDNEAVVKRFLAAAQVGFGYQREDFVDTPTDEEIAFLASVKGCKNISAEAVTGPKGKGYALEWSCTENPRLPVAIVYLVDGKIDRILPSERIGRP